MRTRARSQLKFDLNSFSFAVTPKELILDQRLPLNPEAVFFLEIEKGTHNSKFRCSIGGQHSIENPFDQIKSVSFESAAYLT